MKVLTFFLLVSLFSITGASAAPTDGGNSIKAGSGHQNKTVNRAQSARSRACLVRTLSLHRDGYHRFQKRFRSASK